MTTGAATTRAEVDLLLSDLEALWRTLDALVADFSPRDWSRKHGKHWTYADLPYHLAYLDRECIRVMARGAEAPASIRWLMHSEAEVNAWNARMFAARPPDQTIEETLAQMRQSRDLIRQTLGELSDADLARPAWSPFFGWMSLGEGILGLIGHTYNHVTEARLRLGRDVAMPPLPPALVHRALAFYLSLLERFVDQERARAGSFTAVLDFTGPGGGAWTVRVADGRCHVGEGRATRADLVMTQSPETFIATFAGVKHPLVLMLTGKIRIKGFRALATFGKLFPSPATNPERVWPVAADLAPVPA